MKKILLLLILPLMLFWGCEEEAKESTGEGSIYAEVSIGPSFDLSVDYEGVAKLLTSYQDLGDGSSYGDDLTNATVTLGETELVLGNWHYESNIDQSNLTSGELISLSVDHSEYGFSDDILYPGAPVFSGETSFSHDLSSDLTITWTKEAPEADTYEIYIGALDTASGEDYLEVISDGSTTHTIPGGTLEAFGLMTMEIQIRAVNTKPLEESFLDSRSIYTVTNYESLWVSTAQ